MYIRAAKTEAEDAGISTDGMADSVAKLRDEILALTGVDIMFDEENFKSSYQILEEISEVWEDLTDVSQANVLNLLGGKRNANVLSSIIANFDDAREAMETAANSAGSAWAENEKYLNSIEGKTKQMQASFETMANAVISSDLVKTFVDMAKALADAVTWLQKMGLLLPTIITLVATIKTLSAMSTATNTANAIFGILNGGGDAAEKVTKIKDALSQLGIVAKQLTGTKILTWLQGLNSQAIDADLAKQVGDIAKEMQNASAQTLSFGGALTKFKTWATGVGQGLKTLVDSSVGKLTIGITAVIAAFTAANTMIQNAIRDSIERGNEAYQSTQNTINNAEKGTKELSKLSEEFAELSKGVDKHGNNVSLTDDQYDRYLELVQEIIKIAPALEDAYNKKGASLQTGYVDILKAANKEQEKLIRNAKEAVKTSWETTLGGSRNEINASYGTGAFGIVTGKEVYQPLVDIYERSITAGVTKGSESAEAILKKTIGEDLYKQLRDTYVDDAGYVYLNAKAVYELYNSYEELEKALKAAGANTDWLSGAFGKLEPYVKTYKSELGQVADTMMILAEVSDETGKSFEKISQAGQTDTFYSGLLDILDPSAAPRDNYNALIAYVEAFSDAMEQLEQARQRMANGETWAMVYDGWKTQFGEFPAIMRMFEDAFTSATQSEEESAAAASSLTKTYGELVEALSDVSKATSLLEKARNGDTSTIEMLKQAEELATLLRDKGYDVELDNMFEIGEDGKINWYISSLERYVEDLIRAAFAGTELAKSNPEVVDAIVAEALAFNNATQSATSFAEALGTVTEASDLKEAVKNFDGTDEAMLSILNKVQDVVDAWNKIRGDNEQIDASYFIGFKDGKIDFSKLTSGLNEYKSAMFENSEAAQALEAKFPGIIDYLKKMDPAAAQAAESTLTLSDALDQLGDAADALQNGIGGNNLAEQLANADKLAEQYNTVLKKLGEMGLTDQAADFGWREFLTSDENGIKENVNTIRAYYDALIEYIVASRPELNKVEQEQFRAYLRSWVDDMIDADEVKRKTQEIKDAFSSIKDITDYQKVLADYRKFDGSVSYFEMLEKIYDLVEKYDDISISDLWDFDSSSFKDIGDLQLDKQLDKLAKELKINEDEVESWKDHVKKSFEAAKEAVSAYETASKSINLASSLNSFLADYRSGDKDMLSMLSSAVSLAEELGVKLEDIVKVGSDGKLTFEVSGLTDAFETYIDSLVEAKQLNADLAAQIKNAARAEGELADKAAEAAAHMADMLSKMQGLYSFAEAGTAGETDILSVLKSAQEQLESYRKDFENGLVKEPLSIFDFIDMSGGDLKENVNTAKKVYKEYANELIDSWIADTKEANKGKTWLALLTGEEEWANGLTAEQASWFYQIRQQIMEHLNELDAEIEPTVGDIISNLQTLTDFSAKSDQVVDFTTVYDDLKNLKEILGDEKLELSDIIKWDNGEFKYILNKSNLLSDKIKELSTTIATKLVDAEIEGGATIEDRTAAIEERAKRIQESLTGVADTWGQLTSVVSNVKSLQSLREDYNSYQNGDMSLLDMLSSATSMAETLGISLDEAFSIGADGELVLNIEAMEDGLVGVIGNLEESGLLTANLASQLREAARAEIKVETNAERIQNAYSNFGNATSTINGRTRGQQLSYSDFQSMIEIDPRYVESVEYVNGVLSINRDRYYEITEAMAAETRQMALNEVAMRKVKIEELEKKLAEVGDESDEVTDSMKKQIEKLKLESNGYMVLANEISNATNQFERFRNASGNAEADTYMDAKSALAMINDVLFNVESELYGQLGNEQFHEAIKLLIDPDVDFSDPNWINKVTEKLDESKQTLEAWFGEGTDDNPQTTRSNMNSFWDYLVGGGFATEEIDEAGKHWGKFKENVDVESMAEQFGVTKDAVRAALEQLEHFSALNFDWEELDPEYYAELNQKAAELKQAAEEAQQQVNEAQAAADEARATADEAAKALEDAKKGGDEESIALAETQAELAEQNAQAAERAAEEAKTAAEQAAQSAAEQEQTGTDELKKSLEEILEDVEKLKTEKITLDCEEAITSTQSVIDNMQVIVERIEYINKVTEAMAAVNEETVTTQGSVDELSESEISIDTDPAIQRICDLQAQIESAENDVAYLSSMFIDLDPNPAINSIQSVIDALAVLEQAIRDVNSMSVNTPSSPGNTSSTPGSSTGGTSGARGIRSAPGGRTLVGELGKEIVVDVNSGRWYTVGNNGPEMVNLPKGAIVYNAQKTAELLGERQLDLQGLSMASGTVGNSLVGGGMIAIDAIRQPIQEASQNVVSAVEEEEETLSDRLDAIKEAYDLANDTLNHLIEHEEFNYDKAERASNYDGMHKYLANEIEIYKAIMENSQRGIEELKQAGATDGDEQLQELEEAYWDAYRSMYEVMDNIRDLYTSALHDEVDNIQSAFKNLTDAAEQYNDTGRISIDTFQSLLEGGVQYLGLLKNENGQYEISENSVRNLLKVRKDQLAIETAIAYVDRIREALRNGEVQKVAELVSATGQIGRNTWDTVYANLELAKAEGLTNEQYQAALENLKNLRDLAEVAVDDFDSEDKIAAAKENFEALRKEIEHYIKHQDFSFEVNERAMNFTGMNQALENEVAYYKQIMAEAQETIAEMIRNGADDTNENLQSVEEAYWSAYRSMYSVIDHIRALKVDALTDRLNGLTSAFSTLRKASDEYNKAGGISLDTFESLLSQGFEYMSLLDEQNGKYVIAKDRIAQYVQMRKNQLAIESALSYISQVREALENRQVDHLDNLLKANDQVSSSTWGMVYAQATLLKTMGLSDAQYKTLIANIEKMRALADSVVDQVSSGEDDITDQYEAQKDTISDILGYTEDLIRAETRDRIDALKDQIDAYKEIIDLKKKSLDETKDENEYQEEVADKVKAIAELQAKADLLSLDTSRSAAIERQKLLDQIAEKQKDLGKYQGDHAIDAQKDALDAEYDAFEESKQKEIEELEKTVSSEEKVYQLAIARIRDQWDTLYQDLIAWNTEEGSVINQEITDAWEAATKAVQKYGSAVNALKELTGKSDDNYIVADIPKYHGGGIVGNKGSINEHEVLAVLEKGEAVLTNPIKKAVFTAVDFVKSLGERIGTSVDKIRNFSMSGISPQIMMPAFAGATPAPISQNNQITFSPNISVEFNGVSTEGRDAASFGRDIANATADDLFEAFTKRGIDAIRTLRQ